MDHAWPNFFSVLKDVGQPGLQGVEAFRWKTREEISPSFPSVRGTVEWASSVRMFRNRQPTQTYYFVTVTEQVFDRLSSADERRESFVHEDIVQDVRFCSPAGLQVRSKAFTQESALFEMKTAVLKLHV